MLDDTRPSADTTDPRSHTALAASMWDDPLPGDPGYDPTRHSVDAQRERLAAYDDARHEDCL